MSADSSLGREIRRLRAASGLTPAELSARSGVREAYLAAIEDDREEPSAAALRRIVRPLEPAGASYAQLAAFLTAPELDVSGEYANHGEPRTANSSSLVGNGSSTPTDIGHDAPVHDPDLQFERAVTEAVGADGGMNRLAATCEVCRQSIDTEYYDVNSKVLCARCRGFAESAAEVPAGLVPLATASAFGLGAAVAGAIIYYAILALVHLQIGYVAILIGYMVGYSVRRGARGRGGLRFQVLAVALTYGAIALAYTPIAVGQVMEANRSARAAETAGNGPIAPRPIARPSAGRAALAVMLLFGFMALLPVLVIAGSLPSSLISALIIFFGLRQAWKMTGAIHIQVLGPYRVGPALSAQI